MTGDPEVEALLRERDEARAAKDYARADEVRARIESLGFEVRDSSDGAIAVPKPKFEVLDLGAIDDRLAEPAECAISVHVLHEGFVGDVRRFVTSMRAHCAGTDFEIVITDPASDDGEALEDLAADDVRVLHLSSDPGWAAARNAAFKVSRGAVVAFADLSVECTGDVLGPVVRAFEDPSVGVAGPWGIVTSNLRDFEDSRGPEVDAIEGYFLATRREILRKASLDEKFRWYRHADIDFSFHVRSLGFKAVVTEPAATKHVHRAWTALDADPDTRAKRSKKNFNRFLDHFRGRTDLLVGGQGKPSEGL